MRRWLESALPVWLPEKLRVQSDTNTVTNLGATPEPDPSAATAAGNQALTDLTSAIAWATSSGNTINGQAQQLTNQAQAAANC